MPSTSEQRKKSVEVKDPPIVIVIVIVPVSLLTLVKWI